MITLLLYLHATLELKLIKMLLQNLTHYGIDELLQALFLFLAAPSNSCSIQLLQLQLPLPKCRKIDVSKYENAAVHFHLRELVL
jgi:hypothetical protein